MVYCNNKMLGLKDTRRIVPHFVLPQSCKKFLIHLRASTTWIQTF